MSIEVQDARAEINAYAADVTARLAAQLTSYLAADLDNWKGLATVKPEAVEEALEELKDLAVVSIDRASQYGRALLSYLCNKVGPGVTPTVTSETYDQQARLIVSVGDTYIGSITTWTGGGENACLLNLPFAMGYQLDIAGGLASKYLCSLPDHHKTEQPQ